jgi:hypothetical protein
MQYLVDCVRHRLGLAVLPTAALDHDRDPASASSLICPEPDRPDNFATRPVEPAHPERHRPIRHTHQAQDWITIRWDAKDPGW